MQHLFGIIASVLHLGNIKFEADVRGYASLNDKEIHWVSKVMPKRTAKSMQYSDGNHGVTLLFLFFSCCAVAGDSYSSVTTGLNPQED